MSARENAVRTSGLAASSCQAESLGGVSESNERGVRAKRALLGRQARPGRHLQAWRSLPAHAAHPRRALSHPGGRRRQTAKRAGHPIDRLETWALAVQARTNHNKATCALANNLARIAWAVWVKHEQYRSPSQRRCLTRLQLPRFAKRNTAHHGDNGRTVME